MRAPRDRPGGALWTTAKSASSQVEGVALRRLFAGWTTSAAASRLARGCRRSQTTSAGSSRVACFRRSNRRSAPRRTTSVTGLDVVVLVVKALFIVRGLEMLYSQAEHALENPDTFVLPPTTTLGNHVAGNVDNRARVSATSCGHPYASVETNRARGGPGRGDRTSRFRTS